MFLEKQWQVQLVHMYKEGNMVADCLANMAHSYPLWELLLPVMVGFPNIKIFHRYGT